MKANRKRSFVARALAGTLAVSIGLMPAMKVFAEQVLELPQMTTPSTTPDLSSAAPPHRRNQSAQRNAEAPLPANLGSIEDYEHQGEEDRPSYPGSSSYASSNLQGGGFGGNYGGATLQFEPGSSREALTNNIILGAVVLGLFAMEVDAAHHHHR
jgi:hypothetical protein